MGLGICVAVLSASGRIRERGGQHVIRVRVGKSVVCVCVRTCMFCNGGVNRQRMRFASVQFFNQIETNEAGVSGYVTRWADRMADIHTRAHMVVGVKG